jgi:hypothetical protein
MSERIDPMRNVAGNPTMLKVVGMKLQDTGHEPNLRTITAALVGLRYDMARIIELLEKMR